MAIRGHALPLVGRLLGLAAALGRPRPRPRPGAPFGRPMAYRPSVERTDRGVRIRYTPAAAGGVAIEVELTRDEARRLARRLLAAAGP